MPTVHIPEVRSSTSLLNVSNSGHSYGDMGDYTIDSSYTLTMALTDVIKVREMSWVRKKYPDVDFDKLAQMIASGDSEMVNLGLTTLEQYTKYTHLIIRNSYNKQELERILYQYLDTNRVNITEEVL